MMKVKIKQEIIDKKLAAPVGKFLLQTKKIFDARCNKYGQLEVEYKKKWWVVYSVDFELVNIYLEEEEKPKKETKPIKKIFNNLTPKGQFILVLLPLYLVSLVFWILLVFLFVR